MNRRDPVARPAVAGARPLPRPSAAAPRRAPGVCCLLAGALASLLAGQLGCSGPQVRGQREEESDRERYPLKLVGDVSTFGNARPIPVSGVGLVEDLDG